MNCAIKRILQFNSAVVYGPIQVHDIAGNDITNTCMYSWSTDGVCWTAWTNYNNYTIIAKNIGTDFYLRILLFGTFKDISINGMLTTCYSICLDNENIFLQTFCDNTNLFKPYANLDCALLLQQQLADSVICLFGIPCYYFRVTPNKDTADYTFKEYVLHNVESVKQIQLMIQDGTMPSSKPNFSDFDFDWEVDWDVEIGKTQFATAFGDTAFPKQRDFIYVPMMKRMWEVNSAYDEKNENLLWQSTTWKLGLIKWNEKTNVDQGDFESLIDNLVVNTYDNVFKDLESNEQARETAVAQLETPKYAAMQGMFNVFMEDSTRKSMTKETINISQKQLNNKSVVLAKNIYSFNDENSAIIYQKQYCGDSATISFIIDTKKNIYEKTTVLHIGDISINVENTDERFIVSINNDNTYEIDNSESSIFLVICKWNKKTFNSDIVAYPYTVPKEIPLYKIKPEMYRFDFDHSYSVAAYNNDYDYTCGTDIIMTGYPYDITNFKYFNTYLDTENAIREIIKYSTDSTYCVINDLARPLNSGYGYPVK